MGSYRCYLFDSRGVVIATEDFDCDSESEALEIAHQMSRNLSAAGLELWQRPRLLCAERSGLPPALEA